jgi:hypothetical protein
MTIFGPQPPQHAGAGTAPALAAECRLGPPSVRKGPLVVLNNGWLERDAAYDEDADEPDMA